MDSPSRIRQILRRVGYELMAITYAVGTMALVFVVVWTLQGKL